MLFVVGRCKRDELMIMVFLPSRMFVESGLWLCWGLIEWVIMYRGLGNVGTLSARAGYN